MDKLNMQIGNKIIGEDQPVFIIAEIGVNHNGSLQNARRLIDAAVAAEADAVKFQKRSLKDLYQRTILDNPNTAEQSFQYMITLLKDWELSQEDYASIVEYCREKNIIFLCSPWDLPSVDFIDRIDVPVFKTASADLTNFILLEHILSKHKPLILSTGMATMDEIKKTVEFVRFKKGEFALLHCNSTYPTPFEEINLKMMAKLKKEFAPVLVGYSGHERGIAVSVAAVALGACIIERHITLDRTMPGPDHAASLEPQGFQKMVRDIRCIEAAIGSDRKHLNRMEVLNREVIGKSLIAVKDIPKGVVISKGMVGAKSPGKGVSVQRIAELVGKIAQRDIKNDEFFRENDLVRNRWVIRKPVKNMGKWGLVLRPDDLAVIGEIESPAVEVRFTDKDLETDLPRLKHFKNELIIHSPEYWHRSLLDISSLDETTRKKSVEVMKLAIDKALKLAEYFNCSPKMVIHPGGMSMEFMGQHEKLNANLKRSLDELKRKKVTLMPENMPPRPWFFGGEYFCNNFLDAEEIKSFCEDTGLGICFDLCHAQLYCNLKRKNILEFINIIKPYAEHLHIADAYGVHGEGAQIGEGEIDFKKVIPCLFKGYDKTWIPEIWRGHQDNYKGYYIAMERLSKYLV